MNIETKKLSRAWSAFINDQRPYAATTIQFNREPISYGRVRSGNARDVALAKRRVSEVVLRLEKLFFNTEHVGYRVAADDRFEAFCVVEKVGVHPHVHIGWFLPEQRRKAPLCKIDERLRLCTILETFNRGHRPLEVRDKVLLNDTAKREVFQPSAVANWQALGWSVFSSSIEEQSWPSYMLKDFRDAEDFSDHSFFFSELRSLNQRTKPTRFYSIDPVTGHRSLNFDKPLVPKR